jgi:uncharacterized protein
VQLNSAVVSLEKKAPIVKCPSCRGDSVFAPSNLWRPFCSERCKQIDFGAWASEEFRVPVKPVAQDDEAQDVPRDLLH